MTLARRDITKMITLGLEEGIPGDWAGLHMTYLGIIAGLKRSSETGILTALAVDLADFAQSIINHLELFVNFTKTSGNESHSEQHKQNSNINLHESEPAFKKARSGTAEDASETVDRIDRSEETAPATIPEVRSAAGTPLGMVLEACPDIIEYAETGAGGMGDEPLTIRNWAAFLKTTALVRAMLGISPDAWRDAVETMGVVDASIVIAAILQKGDDIRFPGGYLRALTEKKRDGQFSVGPILMALISARLKEARAGKGSM